MKNIMIGKKFGRLIVLSLDKNERLSEKLYWWCQCDCGSEPTNICGTSLRSGNTKSCGCYNKECVSERSSKIFKKYNTYDLTGDYGIGYTVQGDEFYFDLEDYDKIKDYYWSIHEKYVISWIKDEPHLRMHRLVMDVTDENMIVDHIQHVEHDNRKKGLRIVDKYKNNMNHSMYSNNTSGVNGVSWNSRSNKWIVRITCKNEVIYLGNFDNFNEAVAARKEAEEKYFGEYSYDNSMNRNI